jgi:hypothetical protein
MSLVWISLFSRGETFHDAESLERRSGAERPGVPEARGYRRQGRAVQSALSLGRGTTRRRMSRFAISEPPANSAA